MPFGRTVYFGFSVGMCECSWYCVELETTLREGFDGRGDKFVSWKGNRVVGVQGDGEEGGGESGDLGVVGRCEER